MRRHHRLSASPSKWNWKLKTENWKRDLNHVFDPQKWNRLAAIHFWFSLSNPAEISVLCMRAYTSERNLPLIVLWGRRQFCSEVYARIHPPWYKLTNQTVLAPFFWNPKIDFTLLPPTAPSKVKLKTENWKLKTENAIWITLFTQIAFSVFSFQFSVSLWGLSG